MFAMQHTYFYHKLAKYVFLFIAIGLGVWIFRDTINQSQHHEILQPLKLQEFSA